MTTEDIEDEIARTRVEMADTLTAIERKFSLQQIMDQAVDTMRDFLSDRTRIAEMVRDNPVPLALIGLGLGWMAVSAATGGSTRASVRSGSYESMEGVAPGWSGEEGAGYVPGSESSSDYTARASEGMAEARESVRSAADRTRGKVSEWSRQARSSAAQAADRTRDAYQDHPLTMAAVAMMVGAAVGAMLPRSRAEAETLGAAGDIARQARDMGGELVEKASRVAERAMKGGAEEAERALRQESGSPSSMTH
jgi:ElaB/YqjD/DUF883 family membrane-anchored ribosome-binding protein